MISSVHRQHAVANAEDPFEVAQRGQGANSMRRTSRAGTQTIDMAEVRKTRDPVFVLSSYISKKGEELKFLKKRGSEAE